MDLAKRFGVLLVVICASMSFGSPDSARAACDVPCGQSCLITGQKCCTDLVGGGLQWVCPPDGTCGASYQSCTCSGGQACLGCDDWEFKCKTDQSCIYSECWDNCPGGGTCRMGETCFTNTAGNAACCNTSVNQLCGGAACIGKSAVCCAGNGAPYGCSSDHRCGSKPQECVLIANDLAGCEAAASAAPSGRTGRTGYWLLRGLAVLVVGLAGARLTRRG